MSQCSDDGSGSSGGGILYGDATIYRGQNNVFKYTDRNGVAHIIDKDNFRSWFNNDRDFNEAITRSSLAWTGTFSGWFDGMAKQLMKKLQVTRNAFQGYYEDINDQIKSEENYKEIIKSVDKKATMTQEGREKIVFFSGTSCGTNAGSVREKALARKTELDSGFFQITGYEAIADAGSCTTRTEPPATLLANSGPCRDTGWIDDVTKDKVYHWTCDNAAWYDTSTSIMVSDSLEKAKDQITKLLPEMINDLYRSSAASGDRDSCSTFYGISFFSAITAATRLTQAADFASKALESVDKMRLGMGAQSPIHQLSKQLTYEETYNYMSSNNEILESTTKKPAMNASALSWITTNSHVDLNDNNIRKLSLEGVIKGYVMDVGTFASCQMANLLGNGLWGFISFAGGLFGGLFSDANEDWLFPDGARAIDGSYTSMAGLINEAVERAAYGLIFNPCTQNGGEDVGNCLALGSHYYLSNNHQLSGGSPADMEKLRQFTKEQRQVIARAGEIERNNRSPFDPTSQHTFLGSIVNKILPHAAAFANSSIFSTIGNIVGSSINSLLPSASAITEEVLLSNIGECTYLGGIGAVGDAFCVPYIINDIDPSIRGMSPFVIEETLIGMGAFEDERNADNELVIKKDSNYYRYINYCSNRYSMFGVLDARILLDFVDGATSNGLLWQIISFFDKNSAQTLYLNDPAKRDEALNWATGKYCVATSNAEINPLWDSEMRYYQAHMLYARINDNRGGVKKNNTLVAINDYEQSHPIEDTPDSHLARIAGLPTEDFVSMRDYIAYQGTNKDSFGPTVANKNVTPRSRSESQTPSRFRRSITPLTNFVLNAVTLNESVILNSFQDLPTTKPQETTA